MQQKDFSPFPQPDKHFMISLINATMPYGKYKDRYITDLPVHYLEWFERKGFPEGKLGEYIATMYEIKINGLMEIVYPIIKQFRQTKSDYTWRN